MMYIKENIFIELTKKDTHEECGFVFGNGKTFTDICKVKNVSKKSNEFKMGFWSKAFAIIKAFICRFDLISIYHVHKNGLKFSSKDIDNSIPGFYYFLICDGKLLLSVAKKIDKGIMYLESEYFKILQDGEEV